MREAILSNLADEFAVEDALVAWVRQIERVPLLRPEEEVRLAKRIEDGDDEAYHLLIESNLRLVLRIARKYARVCREASLSLEDLVQEGNIGLMTAARRFDYRKGYRFSTYALYWIHQAISRAVADKGRMIRLPVYVTETLNRVNQTTNQLLQQLGRPPTLAEVAAELNLSEAKLTSLLQRTAEPLSFEMTFDSEDDHPALADFLPDKQAIVPEAAAIQVSLQEQLEWILNRLTHPEQRVLRLRYGLEDGAMRTLEEVARHLELTRERVRQIEKRALEKLRQDRQVLARLH